MTDLYMRVRYLPEGADRAMKRLAKLKVEAENLGAPIDILSDPTAFSAAWDREVQKARLEAHLKGQESSMGVDHVD
jgi:hypothetical protein